MKLYVLKGDPLQLVRIDRENEYIAQKIAIQSAIITLEQQHEEAPPFKGALRLSYTFFMPIPTKGPKSTIESGTAYMGRPHLTPLMKFFDTVCRGILWTDPSQICSVTIARVYDEDPRTELIIREVPYE